MNEMKNKWYSLTGGDINATIAQVGLNLAQLVIPIALLKSAGMSAGFSVSHLLPGYVLGYLIGSLGLVILAMKLSQREKRDNVTAHVYGNNVPAILAYTLLIILPVYVKTHNPILAWSFGAAAVIWTGLFKLMAAPFVGLIRKVIPKPAIMTVFGAAMYSYLALVLLQRIFDNPLLGIIALVIVCAGVLANIPFTKWKIPPFLVAWLIPLGLGFIIRYVHVDFHGIAPTLPLVFSLSPIKAIIGVIPYMSVILPIAIYQILQDISAVEGGNAVGDNYDTRSILFCDAAGTLLCGLAGSVVTPTIYALHPPYKAMGARIGFQFWTPLILLAIVCSGLTLFVTGLFPWPILAAMIAYVAIGVGRVTINQVDKKYLTAVLLGFVIPTGAAVSSTVSSALTSLKLSAANPQVYAALNKTIYWSSIQGLGNGFLFLVLVVSAMITELIDRNFNKASIWCLVAAAFSWLGLLHSARFVWGAQPMYALGWFIAAIILFTAKFWGVKAEEISQPGR